VSQFTPEDRKTLIECNTMLKSVNARLKDHEGRIRKVEGRQMWFVGVGAGIGGALSAMYQYLRYRS